MIPQAVWPLVLTDADGPIDLLVAGEPPPKGEAGHVVGTVGQEGRKVVVDGGTDHHSLA